MFGTTANTYGSHYRFPQWSDECFLFDLSYKYKYLIFELRIMAGKGTPLSKALAMWEEKNEGKQAS